MQKLLILHFHNHKIQPRVRREYDVLAGRYQLFGLGYVDCERAGVKVFTINKPKWDWKKKLIQRFWLLLRRYERVYWSLPQVLEAQQYLQSESFDIILAHNEESLPLALKYKNTASE